MRTFHRRSLAPALTDETPFTVRLDAPRMPSTRTHDAGATQITPPVFRARGDRRVGHPPVSRPPRAARVRRMALLAAALCLIPALVSYVTTMTEPSNSSLGIHTVEWMRDNGARGLVNTDRELLLLAERAGQGWPGAALRCPGRRALAAGVRGRGRHRRTPSTTTGRRAITAADPSGAARRGRVARDLRRRRLAPAGADHELPARAPPTRRSVAGVAWIDHTRTSTWLYPGRTSRACRCPRADRWRFRLGMRGRARGDLQQRLQAVGLGRRLRLRRPHVRAAARRAWRRSSATATARSTSSPGAAVRPPGPTSSTPGRTCR